MSTRRGPRRILGTLLVSIAFVLLAIQLVPYGHEHTNPPVVQEPSWDRPETRRMAVAACYDCHSNETRWPWYSSIAPISWLVQRDVEEGRRVLNFSEWHRTYEEAEECAETILEGEMPPPVYVAAHPEAALSPEKARILADRLSATLGTWAHRED